MRILFALPGLHRYNRGAETAFIAIASELSKAGDAVTLIGSGSQRPNAPYRFMHAASIRREWFESFPSVPILRSEYAYEELTFLPDLMRRYQPQDYDVTLTCNYPFTSWALRRAVFRRDRPPHVFVTQNGDWPATAGNSEYRFFHCEGLVCINPDFYERNKDRWRCRLIPNGVDCDRFRPGPAERHAFGLPADGLIVLMVSALVANKNIELGIQSVSLIPGAHLVLAGDGPLRRSIDAAAARMLPGRFTRLSLAPDRMPALYRSADVFLHLADDEPFGNVFLEAMACGRPIVGRDSMRLRWIVGDDEFLAEDDRPEEIASRIRRACDSSPGLQERRVKRSTAFSWSSVAAMYRGFLQEVVASPGSGR
jgi:glycosyltransferase involved in cell wall biosynthesis